MKLKFLKNLTNRLTRHVGFFKKRQQGKIENHIKKLSKKKVIRVAFLHMYATDTQTLPLFEQMLKDKIFDPYFIVQPDVLRSKENLDFNYTRSKKELTESYGPDRVLDGYNFDTNKGIDYTHDFDIAFTNNPYDVMSHKYFKIRYWYRKGIPMFYSNYSYMGRTKYEKHIYSLEEFRYLWNIFTENYASKNDMISCEVDPKKIVVTGYAKMDKMSYIKRENRNRKKIIIAPHHTIFKGPLNLSSFLKYSSFILNLPKLYPQIDFVFRPHPLLVENLKQPACWGKEKTEDYINRLTSYPNVEYQLSGEYFNTFVNSDALLHDCGSFLAEYMYTSHPQCHMFKNKNMIEEEFIDFGKKMLENVYQAFEDKDILRFIDEVVLRENDYMAQKRNDFAKNEIMLNYPHATDMIIAHIKHEIYDSVS